MNFKILILLFLATACGVKGDPVYPKNEPVPSLLENYPDIKTSNPVNDSKPVGGTRRR